MSNWEGFEIEGRLGVGTTGTVWLARQVSLGRQVALKELAPELAADAAVRGGLRHEAEVLAGLEHPNCVAVYRYLESTSAAAIVMEYVEGVSLRALVERSRLSIEQALVVLEGALEGLAYAHSHDIVHGDVKPENILLATSGQSKLVDFGLATAVGTRRAPGTGSPAYSSPEAAAGLPLGAASDLYSAALVLYQLLTGVIPPGGAAGSVLDAQAGLLAAPVASLVGRALDPDPAVRPASAAVFLEELRAAADQACGPDWRRRALLVPLVAAAASGAAGAIGVAKATAATSAPRRVGLKPSRLLRTHPWAAASSAVIVIAAAASVAASTWSSSPKAHPAAAILPTVPLTTSTSSTTPVDLRTINWGDVTVPGRVCGPDVTQNVTLHNGQATVQDPGVRTTQTVPGDPEASGQYPLAITIQPQFGQLAGGPHIAVLALTCSFSGVGGPGQYETTAVFDAPEGTPQLLALFSDVQYGTNPVVLSPTRFEVSDGKITVYGSYLQAGDPFANPTGRGFTTIVYSNGTVVPSGVITTGATPASVPPTIAPVPTTAPPAASPTSSAPIAPASRITLAGLETVIRSDQGSGATVRCGPAPAGLGIGAYVACGIFDPNIGGAQEIVQITGTSPSSFNVVIGPGSDICPSVFNAGERAALSAFGMTCGPRN